MGFAISWLAVSGKSPQQVLDELGLMRDGQSEAIPESALTCATLQGGWFVVFANEFDSPLVARQTLCKVSEGCTVVSCRIEEHVMFSSVTCYVNGSRSWYVAHDAQEGIYHLTSSGDVPTAFRAIHDAIKLQQDAAGGEDADVDYLHDVPVDLAKAVTAFRHDEDVQGTDDEPFKVLRRDRPKAKPWWKFW